MQKDLPNVSIITVDYNGKHLLKDCLSSVFELNYPQQKLEVIMVDNGSTDDSAEFVRRDFPQVKVIKNDGNNYCQANNLGINNSQGEYVALINNDVVLDKGWLEELIKVMGQDSKIGLATGKILFADGRLQGAGHYEFPNFYWSDRGFKEEDNGQYNKIEDVQSISHCAALYRKKCLDDIGLLDEDFHMYMEDVDMSIRAKQKAWRLVYIPTGIAYHKFHGSAKEEEANFYLERNRLLLITKHYPERLCDSFSGKEYFNVAQDNRADNSKSLNIILPDLVTKLLKHHNGKLAEKILPDIFANLKKMLDLDKHRLIQRLDYEIKEKQAKEKVIIQLEQDINNISREKEKATSLLKNDIETICREKEKITETLNNNIEILKEKENKILSLNRLYNLTKSELHSIYSAKGYFYCDILRNWKLNSYETNFKKNKGFKVLLIKPQRITNEDTKRAVLEIKRMYPEAKIALLANLLEEDYLELMADNSIDLQFFYCPSIRKFSLAEKIKVVRKIRAINFDLSLVLMSRSYYAGYRRAEMISALSGAKRRQDCYIDTDYKSIFDGKIHSRRKGLLFFAKSFIILLYKEIILFLIAGFCFIFISAAIKIMKFKYRIKQLLSGNK